MYRFEPREKVLNLVSIDGKNLQHCSKKHKGDLEIAKAAVLQNPAAIQFVAHKLYSNHELMGYKIKFKDSKIIDIYYIPFLTLKNSGENYQFFSYEMQNDKKIIYEAVKRGKSNILQLLPFSYQLDEDFIMTSLERNFDFFQFIPECFKCDKKIFRQSLEIESNNNYFFYKKSIVFDHGDPQLKNDPDIIDFMLEKSIEGVKAVFLAQNIEFIKERVEYDISLIDYYPELTYNKDIMLYAIKLDPKYLTKLSTELLKDKEYLTQCLEEQHDILKHIKDVPGIKSKIFCHKVLKMGYRQFSHLFTEEIEQSFETYLLSKGMYIQFFDPSTCKVQNLNFWFQ